MLHAAEAALEGLGPWENYPDRKAACWRAVHAGSVAGQYVPYIMPQEHGLKCDTRWLELSSDSSSVRIASAHSIAFSAGHFRPEDLTRATHTIDLQPRAETILCIDAAHRGLGTGSCGPDVFEPYKIKGSRFTLDLEWKFSGRAFPGG
ncbi:MAG: beta-galactosidase small subunit [Terrimicrobiaceae bacterium]|nr:beta-galactosidase small subunit [Terrimicrobiaceae bacterium]